MLSLIAPQENIVSPEWSAVVKGAQLHLLAQPYGHEAPLFMRSVYAEVETWLRARGVERGADQCRARACARRSAAGRHAA